jgi:hypothetical protein
MTSLFVTDEELVAELGVPEDQARAAIRMLDTKKGTGFPKKNPLWGNRRYLPAVQEWLLRTNLPTLRTVNGGSHD